MSSPAPETMPPEIAAIFAGAPEPARSAMMRLRALILDTAASNEGIGALTETLKWGEPSYAPAKPRTGSSVRIAARGSASAAALFICHTGMVAHFRALYPGTFRFEGDRALVFDAKGPLPEAELRHCVALALTWHRRKKG